MDIPVLNAMFWTIYPDIICRLVLFTIESQNLVDHCIPTSDIKLDPSNQLVHFIE